MADSMKYVKLKRSETCGFGFSILGGAGSELPPIIYDIIEGSPAANSCQLAPGDIIWEVNGQEVITFTTKEVLNCLRLSASEVTLKLKTADAGIQQRVQQYLATPNNSDVLRTAITRDDLQGVRHIKAKKSSSRTPPEQSSSTPPSLPSPTLSDASDRATISHGSNHTASENGIHVKDRTTAENERNKQKPKNEAYLMTEDAGKTSIRTSSTTSPPLSEDESDIDSLHSFHYSPKAVDIPSAVRLAKRLISLDGFKKSDVSRHLSKNNEFSRAVAEEYLNYFDFRGDTLDKALRKFLDKFCLTGETQERERVLVHFSRRYLDCNPGTFNSQDAVHTLTCALMLLNTDLHGQSVGRKMTCNEFIDNLADLNDGENFPREVLKSLYQAMRSQPLQWATDDDVDTEGTGTSKTGSSSGDSQGVVVGSNPFLSPPTGNGIVYKKGYIMRKCCTDPNGKKTAFGKRSWKMWFCVVQDLVLYLHKDEQGARRGPQHAQLGHNAIRLHHALATRAHDYSKKEHVFRLQTADQAEYLLQTSDSKELQAWIDTINLVAASLSAPPLPGAVGSQRKFQRPLLPCSITKLNLTEQLEDHTERLAQLERELEDHKAHPPEKTSRAATASNYREKEAYLNSEVKRYRTYVYLLRSRLTSQQSGQQGTNAGIDVGDLPVFEARPAGEGAEGGERGARVVPPPIPERARPGDSPPPTAKFSTESKSPETSLGIASEGSQVAPAQNGDDALTLKNNKLEENKIGELEDSVSNKGTLKKKSKEEREKKKLEKENEKFMKEIERKEKEVEKKEKARERKERDLEKKEKEKEKKDQDKKEKEQQQKEKKQKEKEKKKWDPSQVDNDKEIKEKENKEQEDKQKETPDEDPRIGTLNRLSALFKFSKLNSKSGQSEDDNTIKKGHTVRPATDPEAPPLPPKPSPNSPIMKNLGTRLDI
ncbi:PH and SEC7 domain-containing protein-like isoform X4 [Penaeus indicus]|uniref:PH and SEC7 domain-containing protein-like isoform X4 n=1 Tax=Penaeus indicus TaxID=29960 RepID=UPI00300D56C1